MKEIRVGRKGLYAQVSDEDYNALNVFTWSPCVRKHTYYAITRYRDNSGKTIFRYMHRVILGATHGQAVDHVDGDGLNNTRENLRIATKAQNAWNTSPRSHNKCGYKGVYKVKHNTPRPFIASIRVNKKFYPIGRFSTAEDAGEAYKQYALKLQGEFAFSNRKQ